MEKIFIFTMLSLASTTSAVKLRPVSGGYDSTTLPTLCGTSRDCESGSCCRRGTQLVDPSGWGNMFGNPFLQGPGGINQRRGSCSSTRGRQGEVCSYGCQCGEGLLCYRPMSGVCCPPSTCEPADFVKKQREYWRKCFTNPKCQLPRRR